MFGRKKKQEQAPGESEQILRCSFCNKSQRHVKKLIAGPNVQICDECVGICVDVLADDRREHPGQEFPDEGSASEMVCCSLCHLPTTLGEAVVVGDRGLLCPGCVGEIQAAAAEEDSKPTDPPR